MVRPAQRAWLRSIWMVALAASLSASAALSSWAQESRKTIGLSPLVSNVANIPAEEAQEVLINALMRTDRFAIRPPDANGAFSGVDFVLEPTINEGKGKSNVLGFLKDSVISNTPISLDVRIFDPRTAALVSLVTVNSADMKSEKAGLGELESVMGGLGLGNKQASESSQIEGRIGGLMRNAANRLADRLGGNSSTGRQRAGSMRTPFSR